MVTLPFNFVRESGACRINSLRILVLLSFSISFGIQHEAKRQSEEFRTSTPVVYSRIFTVGLIFHPMAEILL